LQGGLLFREPRKWSATVLGCGGESGPGLLGTFVMYRSRTAIKLAVARIARIRPGLAGLEGVATRRSSKAWVALNRARRARSLSGELRTVVY
jgi:hypothetical protein